jgi:hypothetical protein
VESRCSPVWGLGVGIVVSFIRSAGIGDRGVVESV